MTYAYDFPLALVLAGVPIPGKSNPYIVLVTPNARVHVEVDVEEASQPTARLEGLRLGWRFEIAFKSFVDTLSGRLEQPLLVRLRAGVDGVYYPPAASVYAAATLAVVHAVADAGGYSLEPREVLEAANSIDGEAGVDLDYVDGLRTALTTSTSIVFRRGEEPVELNTDGRIVLELVGEEDVGEDYSSNLSDTLLTALTRLSGLSTLEAARLLREGKVSEALELVRRLDNAVFYLLYSVNPPEGACKWTPSLQRVYGVCAEGVGLGDRVEFTL